MERANVDERVTLLRELASRRGITDSYCDIEGKVHETTDEVRAELLGACGFRTATVEELRDELSAMDREAWSHLVEPVLVRTQAELANGLRLHAPGRVTKARLTLIGEDGSERRVEADSQNIVTIAELEVAGGASWKCACPLPVDVELGYYDLDVEVEMGEQRARQRTRLIVCPERAYLPGWYERGEKVAGLAISLYGLRSHRNCGAGDLGDLRRFIEWAASTAGVQFVGLNPIHSIFNRQPYNASPYLPTSRYYRNSIYIDLSAVEDFTDSPEAQALFQSAPMRNRLVKLRAADTVQYEEVASLKLELLDLAFGRFREHATPERRRAFEEYVAAEGVLLDNFATFCAIYEHVHAEDPEAWSWTDWPEELQDPASPAVSPFREEHAQRILFFKYLQWQLELQLAAAALAARAGGMRVGLYLDLALAVDRHGADNWAYRHLFVDGAKSGAPPDPLGPQGQDWQFPPPNRDRYREDAYRLFSEKIRKNCRHAGALRLDHVMRLVRLFWIPRDRTPSEGAYVLDFHEDLLKIVCLESVRNQTMIIGEDLGTVPDSIREELSKRGILSYRVFYFERRLDGSFKGPGEYPRLSIATLSTHDLPTLAGYWDETDIARREEAGLLVDEDDRRDARLDRRADKMRVAETTELPLDAPVADVRDRIVEFLAATNSAMMMLNQEDLFLEREQQNMPGTTVEHLNWARKMRYSIEQIARDPEVRTASQTLHDILARNGRASRRLRTTRYFDERVLEKRPYVRMETCARAIEQPARREVRADGRVTSWIFLPDMGTHLRIVTLEDGETVHNAFLDHDFKED